MNILWTESNRITTLTFENILEFSLWIKDQEFKKGETIEFITGSHD